MATKTNDSTKQEEPWERGAKIIALAWQLMETGRSKGWSDAIAQARKQVRP